MNIGIACTVRLLETPLERGPRLLLLLAIVLIAVGVVAPFWNVVVAPVGSADPDTYALRLGTPAAIPPASQAGAWSGGSPTVERICITAGLVGLALLFARAALLGTLRSMIDSLVVYFLFSAVALRLLGFELARLAGPAARTGWTGLLFGRWQGSGGQFAASPGLGAWILALVAIVLACALAVAWRGARKELAADFVVAG